MTNNSELLEKHLCCKAMPEKMAEADWITIFIRVVMKYADGEDVGKEQACTTTYWNDGLNGFFWDVLLGFYSLTLYWRSWRKRYVSVEDILKPNLKFIMRNAAKLQLFSAVLEKRPVLFNGITLLICSLLCIVF